MRKKKKVNKNEKFEGKEPQIRVHQKSGSALLKFLKDNNRLFNVDSTATGFPTFNIGNKAIYIRDKKNNVGSLAQITNFHTEVGRSQLYRYLYQFDEEYIENESNAVEKSLIYKGFCFDPEQEVFFSKVVKVDFNTAYWQTSRYFRIISKNLYRNVVNNCAKKTRLRLTGTLGLKSYRTPYTPSEIGTSSKGKSFQKNTGKRRLIFQNIYNRLRKFVDEMMIWCWMRDPSNFIGYYVDCFWIKEYDFEMIEKIKEIYDVKIELVDITVKKNRHNRYYLEEVNTDTGEVTDEEMAFTPYDTQFKSNEFVSYKFFHNFNPELKGLKIKTTGWNKQQM